MQQWFYNFSTQNLREVLILNNVVVGILFYVDVNAKYNIRYFDEK